MLVPKIKHGDWNSVDRAITLLAGLRLGPESSPTFSSFGVSGLTASRLVSTDSSKKLASVANLASWIAGTTNEIDVADDGDGSVTLSLAAGAAGTLDHNELINTHNLTTDINHNALTNYVANEHIDWTGATQDFLTTGFGTINGLVPGTDDTYDLGKEEVVGGGGYELKDTQSTYADGSSNFTNTTWAGQTFTPSEDYSLAKVVVYLWKSAGAIGDIATLHVQNTSAGKPTGGDLASKSVDISGLGTSLPGTAVEFIFDAPISLTNGTMYAFFISHSTGYTMKISAGSTGTAYTGGTLVYTLDSGGSWTILSSWDTVFYCYSSADTTEYTRWQDLYLSGSLKDGTNSLTIANLQSAYDHIHNLTTDIDHDALTNFAANEHFLQTAITNVSTALSTGLLKVTTGTGALSVVTDNSANWNTAYGWGNHASAGYAVAGGAYHDGFSDFVANEHIDWTNTTNNLLTTGKGTIGGGSNQVQFIVKANASQALTNPLFQLQKSDGTPWIEITTDSYKNMFIGVDAGDANTLDVPSAGYGNFNMFIGYEAGTANTSGWFNTGIGYQALYAVTTGDSNFAMGAYSLYSCTTGVNNFAMGVNSLYSNILGAGCVAIGANALYSNTGNNNFGMGLAVGYKLTSGVCNTMIGTNVAAQTSTAWAGNHNIFIGWQAAYNIASNIDYNICIGGRSGYNIAGANNVFVGYNSGYNATGASNVFIGYQAGYNETGSNKLYIENSNSASPLIYGDFSTNLLKINGYLEVNQASTSAAVPVAKLTQADVDDSFIDYVGTSAADATKSISTWTAGNSIQGFVKIEINGASYWMPYYDAPTS